MMRYLRARRTSRSARARCAGASSLRSRARGFRPLHGERLAHLRRLRGARGVDLGGPGHRRGPARRARLWPLPRCRLRSHHGATGTRRPQADRRSVPGIRHGAAGSNSRPRRARSSSGTSPSDTTAGARSSAASPQCSRNRRSWWCANPTGPASRPCSESFAASFPAERARFSSMASRSVTSPKSPGALAAPPCGSGPSRSTRARARTSCSELKTLTRGRTAR